MGVFNAYLKIFMIVSLLIPLIVTSSPSLGYLQENLPNIVLSKDEIFSLNMNDYFQINSPTLNIPNISLKSTIDWQIKTQYNLINEFPINFTFIKALPISSSPYIIFLSQKTLYLYEFINSKSPPNLLQTLFFNDINDFKDKNIECLDANFLDSFRLLVDCNIINPLGWDSIFFVIEMEGGNNEILVKFMKIKDYFDYQVELYLDYMMTCPRKLYAYGSRIMQYCEYLSLMEIKDSCFQQKTCSNHIILWQINENKINFLLILDEFSLNVKPQFLPLKIQEILIYWKTDTLMLLELTKGVYQFDFSNLQLKQEKSIEFNDENDTIYLGMEINKSPQRMQFNKLKYYLIVCSTRYCSEVLLKDSNEFYFAKRYDYHYFMENYIDNSSALLFQSTIKKTRKLSRFFSINLREIQINNNFLNLMLDLQVNSGPIEHYQLIFSRKQERIAIHYMRRLFFETNFLRINFLYDEGDYYLEMVNNYSFWRLTEITDLYLILNCCPIQLNNKIFSLSIPLHITTQAKPENYYKCELSITLIPLNYPHVLSANNQLKFKFEDPIIYIKLAHIAIGPEIEFIYLSGNNENFKLTIDHIHQTRFDLNDNILAEFLKYDLVASWIDNDNYSLKMVFTYRFSDDLNVFYRFAGLECLNILNTYLGDCRVLPKYEYISLSNPIDFYFETMNSLVYLHEINTDYIKFYNLIQNFTVSLPLTPTKSYSIVIFEAPNLIFGIPMKNNSIEIYYIPSESLFNSHQTEKILNIDAHYLGLNFDLNISQIDLTLIYEGIIIIVSRNSSYSSFLIVLQMVQSEYLTPRFIVRLASIRSIDVCEILVLKVKKIILVCSDSITEMHLNNPFYVDRIRNYPLYRYNLNIDKRSFTDDKLIYVYASYYSMITMSIQPVLLVYDPSKTAASLLVTTMHLISVLSLVQCVQIRTDLSLLLMTCLGDYVLSKNKLKEKISGIFLNMIALQPALTGVFRFKNDEQSHNKKQNEKDFEINVSFTNENSNRDLVSTLHINMNLKDYNIFLFNHSLQNESVIVKFSKTKKMYTFIDSNFFKGPIEDYEITNYKNDLFVLNLKDYLTEGSVIADYQESLYNYGIILDMISTQDFIIVLSQYKLILYRTDDFPMIFYQESVHYKNDQCKLAHHNKDMIFILSCFNSFDLTLYKYDENRNVYKTLVKIPNYLGLISKLVPINNYLFIETHLFNTLNETEFCVCEFPHFLLGGSLKVIGIINSEDFELMNIKSQDFELIEIFTNENLMKFGLFIVQTYQIMYMEINLIDNKTLNKSLFATASNQFTAKFTSITIDKILIPPTQTTSYFKIIGLIGTDDHLYELELEFDPKKRLITFGPALFVYRKYCKCQNLASKPLKFQDYVARVCSYNLKEKDLTINLFKEESKDLYHFIQVYKKSGNQTEAHPIRVIKVLYSPEISKIFLFYQNSYPKAGSLHLLSASYLNYLVDYNINHWMSLGIYFLKANEEMQDQTYQIKIIAKNDFSAQDINVTIVIEGEEQKVIGWRVGEWIIVFLLILIILFAVGIWLFWKHRKKLQALKAKENSPPANRLRGRLFNNIELGYVD